ncbi:calponin homology domain-containing protein [Cantharellus anzutake]|uniref:calponin homology domain-containing protein n=1 Tax=Cantharellus anzutake TaxID=1750568 RepID=UPI001903A730|nr:calponin homology domain-containing protein [Cantharellus anzutake]KAF8321970.1 calponin homology domain-containing protein [Cantharellus anzutake]
MDSIQERTFCKWLNTKLETHGYPPMISLMTDLSDGVRLIQLMIIQGDVSLGKYNKSPRMRIQKAENVTKALDFIASRGVKLTNIGPEDIIDGNLKLILGMIWTLILRFTIADIRKVNCEEGLSAKEGLLLWCQRQTARYQEVDVQDFTYSWTDGLALCALIHRHRPELLDYHALDFNDHHGNTRKALQVAQGFLGIPQLLEVEDLCDARPPDERSVMTYVAGFFHAFSSMDQAETVSRRVEKFADLMMSVWASRNDYEARIRTLLAAMREKQDEWKQVMIEGTYATAMKRSADFVEYKQTVKRGWVTEKQDLASLLGNIQTKLKTYNLRPYQPPSGLGIELQDLDVSWTRLLEAEKNQSKKINSHIRNIKEALRHKFARAASEFERKLRTISLHLSSMTGPLESQQDQVEQIQHDLAPLNGALDNIAEIEEELRQANIEENDHTVFTHADLEFELKLVQQTVVKKIKFLDNQIVARNMSNLTPAQLEQFESTFRYFDKNGNNTLSVDEMVAALASLGIACPDEEVMEIHDQLVKEYGDVTFEAFINLMVEITEDQTSPDQLRDAFRGLAYDKEYVTEVDLKAGMLPQNAIDYLREAMPKAANAMDQEGYDYEAWLDQVFH